MKILKDGVIYLSGEILSRVMPFLLIPYLSRKLGVGGFGELSYYQTYLALFVVIFGLTQEGAVSRYFYFYGKNGINLIVQSGYIYAVTVGLLVAIFCLLIGSEILFYGALSSIFVVFINVQLSVRQCQKQSMDYAKIQFLFALLPVLTTILMLEFFSIGLVEKRVLALLIANFITFVVAYYFYKKHNVTKKLYTKGQYKLGFLYVLSYGIPLFLHNFSIFARGQLDKMLIYRQFDEKSLGVYAMGATLASVVSVGLLAVNKAVLPYYYEALKRRSIDLYKIKKCVVYSFIFVPMPSIVAYFMPESVFVWLLGESFFSSKYYFVLFLLSTMLILPYLFLVNYLYYYGKNQWISFCSILATVIYVVVLLLVLMLQKIEYVPFASVVGAVVILPVLWVMTKRVKI